MAAAMTRTVQTAPAQVSAAAGALAPNRFNKLSQMNVVTKL
jgi:hypothetical protein